MADKKETKLAAVVSGEAKVKEQFKKSLQNVDVLNADGEMFEHRAITGYSLNGPYLVVQEGTDSQTIYHMGNLKQLKIWSVKE